jgi:adenylate cyclase
MAAKILIVDDESDVEVLIARRFRRHVRDGEFQFVFSGDGEEALATLRTQPDIDLVVTDINMPRMDGLTLLEHLNALNPFLKAVIISAYDDMANIRTAMNRGAFDFVTKPIDFSDLEITIKRTLSEIAGLRSLHDERAAAERARTNLARYFSPSLVDVLSDSDNPYGQAREQPIAVLFADILGFTSLCFRQSPESIFRTLNSFFDQMADEVFEWSGTLDKYIGDGLMATFGTPDTGPQDATNALRCALSMQHRVRDWNGARAEAGDPPIEVAIGIHCGPALIGHIGNERRLEFTAIGDTVNVASRLERLARPLDSEVVVSDDLVQAVRRENPGGLTELESLHERARQHLRGREEAMTVWTRDRPTDLAGHG